MKKALIISPYFPPVNAADMHRVRTSLSYFKENEWEVEIVAVDPKYVDFDLDDLLLQSIPAGIKIHKVKAVSKTLTSTIGLGSLALRALWFYKKHVNQLLKRSHFDLIYFSTTQFPVCILGAYWKQRFNIPYVIDMQDPWHSNYYQNKPKDHRPAKYWFSYRLNKALEPIAVKNAAGLISVSEDYIIDLKVRYPEIKNIPSATITFGMFQRDLEIAISSESRFKSVLDKQHINIVYVGRGGADMHLAISPIFKALAAGLKNDPEYFNQLRFYFIGTSYAPPGKGKPTILPLANKHGVERQVIEVTDRISYYHTFNTLIKADALFMPGSDDAKYTASKIYPYIMTSKPLLGIFNDQSPAIKVMEDFEIKTVYGYNKVTQEDINDFLYALCTNRQRSVNMPDAAIKSHSAQTKTKLQCLLFEQAIAYHGKKTMGKVI